MIYIEPICISCIHFFNGEGRSCQAFEEIPEDIWMGDLDHDQVIPGQTGSFTYTPEEGKRRPTIAEMENGTHQELPFVMAELGDIAIRISHEGWSFSILVLRDPTGLMKDQEESLIEELTLDLQRIPYIPSVTHALAMQLQAKGWQIVELYAPQDTAPDDVVY